VALLERIVDDGLLNAIADGTFGIMKRPADRGKGLDGVAGHEPGYYNPATELLGTTSRKLLPQPRQETTTSGKLWRSLRLPATEIAQDLVDHAYVVAERPEVK
jgi:D-Lysine 5,6-aminomutase TIM-barrel domain of alpha subunit